MEILPLNDNTSMSQVLKGFGLDVSHVFLSSLFTF